ncbi:MAG: HAD-IA family hydrolase [Croceibacterium sp.]
MSVRLAVFDCDGTLVDGQAAVCGAMVEAFADSPHPAPANAAIRRIVGLSLPVAMRKLAPHATDNELEALVAAYRAAFFKARTQGRVSEPLYPGIRDLLEKLHGQGWRLGVATGKSDRGLTGCLTNHAVIGLFTTLQTADRHPSKPHPSMLVTAMAEAGAERSETVMIGDTVYDIELAHAAGCRAIGVAWGYHAPEELLAAGAEAVAETAEQLGDLLDA